MYFDHPTCSLLDHLSDEHPTRCDCIGLDLGLSVPLWTPSCLEGALPCGIRCRAVSGAWLKKLHDRDSGFVADAKHPYHEDACIVTIASHSMLHGLQTQAAFPFHPRTLDTAETTSLDCISSARISCARGLCSRQLSSPENSRTIRWCLRWPWALLPRLRPVGRLGRHSGCSSNTKR